MMSSGGRPHVNSLSINVPSQSGSRVHERVSSFVTSPRGVRSPRQKSLALSPRNGGPLSPRRQNAVSLSGPTSPSRGASGTTPMLFSPTHANAMLLSPTTALDTWLETQDQLPSDKEMDASFQSLSRRCFEEADVKTGKSNTSERRRMSKEIHLLEQLLEDRPVRRATEPPPSVKFEQLEQSVKLEPIESKHFLPSEASSSTGDRSEKGDEASVKREIRRRALRAKKIASGIAPAVKKSMCKKLGSTPAEKEAIEQEKKNRRLLRNREAAMRSRKLAKEKIVKVEEELEEVYEQVEGLQETNSMLKQQLQILSNSALGVHDSLSPRRRQQLASQLEEVLRCAGDGPSSSKN